MIKLTPSQWQKILGFVVLDPDGWDRQGDFRADWNKPLTLNQFLDKADNSTTTRRPNEREKYLELFQNHVESWLGDLN